MICTRRESYFRDFLPTHKQTELFEKLPALTALENPPNSKGFPPSQKFFTPTQKPPSLKYLPKSTVTELFYYGRRTAQFRREPGQERETYRICQLARMVKDYRIHANRERRVGLRCDKTLPLAQKSWPMGKRSQREPYGNRYNATNH